MTQPTPPHFEMVRDGAAEVAADTASACCAGGDHGHRHASKHDHLHRHDHRGHPHAADPHDHGDHAHAHDAHHDHLSHASGKRLVWALLLTAGFMVLEVLGAWWSGSLALLADAGHMLTDAAALALALFAVIVSRRPADRRRSYGYDRMQVLAAFVNGLALLLIVVWIVIEAMQRLWQPPPVAAQTLLWVALAGLVVNLLVFALLHAGAEDNLNVKGAVAHVLGDLLGSLAAILAAVIIHWTGWMAADPLLSLLVALLILRSAWRITADAAHILLEGAPEAVDVADLERAICSEVAGVNDVHHSHLWSITPQRRVMTLHAVVDPSTDPDTAVAAVSHLLRARAGVEHVTVQVERRHCAAHAAGDHPMRCSP